MFPYIPNTSCDHEEMLKVIGVDSVEKLFSDIPSELKLDRALNLAPAKSELEITDTINEITSKNIPTDELVCFLGAGAYDHYVPSIIKHLTSRSEFCTAYTPYQPEISQGTLQGIFEYQTMICNLTDMEVSNASVYDGPTGCAEAAMMAVGATKRKNILISKSVNPETRKILKTYMKFRNVEVVEVDITDGVTDIDKLTSLVDNKTAAVITQNPNFFGIVEDLTEVEKIAHNNKALLIMNVDPISLGILKTPGEIGADIVVGEGQSLGNSLNFGGPYLGFIATTNKLVRKMPGRIAGQTTDLDGKRAFVLTLQAREQHIRRDKANSNICSNQNLNALSAAIYLATIGKEGIREIAESCYKKAHYTYNNLLKTSKFKPMFNKPFFKEFAVESTLSPSTINSELLNNKILGGLSLEKDYPTCKNGMLFCVTEKRTKKQIDTLVSILEGIK